MTVDSLLATIIVGLGATLVMDLWSVFANRALGVPLPNYCLIGRWLLHMQNGVFAHASIAAAAPKPAECPIGWIAHYTLGTLFALALVAFTTPRWLQSPTLPPALLFGTVTVVFPLFIMQPAFGLGFGAAKAPQPMQMRLRSLANHVVFGIGLYLSALVVSVFAVPRI